MSQTLERLRELGGKKIGDPMPTWMHINNWADPLSALCRDAVAEIESLQKPLQYAPERIYHPHISSQQCHVCGLQTVLCCSNCAINFGAKVYVCSKPACRTEHERKCWGDKP